MVYLSIIPFGFDVEALKAVPVVNNLLTKVHELQRWPGNHILFR